VLIERMLGRAKESGRADDTPEAMKTRLEGMKPPAELLAHYRKGGKLTDVDGTPGVAAVTDLVIKALGLEAVTP
jgi:adenylate kinase